MKKPKIIIEIITGILVLILLIGTLIGINSLKANKVIGLNERFILKPNKTISFKDHNQEFKIKLVSIVDDRCPKNAICVWEGSFTFNITINDVSYKLDTKTNTINIKATDYQINLIESSKNTATFTIAQNNDKLTEEELREMSAVDNYLSGIMNEEDYKKLTLAEKITFVTDALNKLALTGTGSFNKSLIKLSSIRSENNDNNTTIYFEYTCGVAGSVIITETTLTYTIDNNMSISNSIYSERGFYYDTLNQPDAPSFYTIAMGAKPTGGYSIIIDKVNIDANENVEVIIKEQKPKPSDTVTQAFTYPVCKLTLNKLPKSIVIKNTDGDEFKPLKSVVIYD